ncbi:glutamic acid-rich protein-like [Belonocnema kinseyi]|uniref:glutamic acid-rich protein-like n=1 Tax=Belonocnema kinseyi TaxID=2817044 RepID=UPI00143DC8FE|nr:glutamic acid-rich protein-like [Belonocnema kinseyi]
MKQNKEKMDQHEVKDKDEDVKENWEPDKKEQINEQEKEGGEGEERGKENEEDEDEEDEDEEDEDEEGEEDEEEKEEKEENKENRMRRRRRRKKRIIFLGSFILYLTSLLQHTWIPMKIRRNRVSGRIAQTSAKD